MKRHFVNAGYDAKKCAVMENMIDLGDMPAPKNLAKKWQKHNPPTIGFMGRLAPEKGAEQLLQAIALLKQKNKVLNLRIGGAGVEEKGLHGLAEKLQISEQIQFCEWITQEKKIEFFASIDVLCVPSNSETFGLVVLEAWKNSVPVIAAKTGGLAEIIENGKTGLHYPKGGVVALAENIEKILFSEENLGQRLSDNGREKVSKYGIDEISKRLENQLLLFMNKYQ